MAKKREREEEKERQKGRNTQPPFNPSVGSLCHFCATATHLSYRFFIFETSATALCGTTGSHNQRVYVHMYMCMSVCWSMCHAPPFLVRIPALGFPSSRTALWRRKKNFWTAPCRCGTWCSPLKHSNAGVSKSFWTIGRHFDCQSCDTCMCTFFTKLRWIQDRSNKWA